MNRIITGLLVAALFLVGCTRASTQKAGEKFVGKWAGIKTPSDVMEISRNGNDFLVTFQGGNKFGAVLKEGSLEISGVLGPVKLTYIQSSGTVIMPDLNGSKEYQRVTGESKVAVPTAAAGATTNKVTAISLGQPNATRDPDVFNKIELKLDLDTLIAVPSSAAGADAPYNDAVKHAVAYGSMFIEHSDRPDKQGEFGVIVDKIIDAADRGLGESALQFEALPAPHPKNEWQSRSVLISVEHVICLNALIAKKNGDNAGAERDVRAGLLWGYRLFNNGRTVNYKSAGIASISEALDTAIFVYNADPAKLAAANALREQYKPIGLKWYNKQCIILDKDVRPDCADLYNLAEHDKDLAWRADAIMWLGFAQWRSAIGAQRASIQDYLRQRTDARDELSPYAEIALKIKREDIQEIANNLPR